VLGIALLGGAIVPTLIGVIITATDQNLIPLLLAGFAIAATAVAAALQVQSRTRLTVRRWRG
jgi:fucose permease